MPIVITWPETTEYLDIDLDHLDSDSIEKIEETKEWWPSTRDWYPGEGVIRLLESGMLTRGWRQSNHG